MSMKATLLNFTLGFSALSPLAPSAFATTYFDPDAPSMRKQISETRATESTGHIGYRKVDPSNLEQMRKLSSDRNQNPYETIVPYQLPQHKGFNAGEPYSAHKKQNNPTLK